MSQNVPRRRRVEQDAFFDRIPFKRVGDLLIASILLTITLPLMIIVALAIKLESKGTILEMPICIGAGGRRFQMLNFRTRVNKPKDAASVSAQTTTRVGQFLRHTRIEALPQLVNVLRGEMSMIDRDARSPSFLD